MKLGIIIFCLLICLPTLTYSETYHEIILKNGVIVRGIIVGQEDQDTIEIKLKDGRSVFYKTADILNIQAKEEPEFNKQSVNRAFPLSLSLFFPLSGLGQFYNHDTDTGIIYITLGIISASLIYTGSRKEIDKKEMVNYS